MSAWKNRTVLITGASYGIGTAFAEQLAAQGAHLILTARSRERLENLAAKLRTQHNARVEIICADLAAKTGAQEIFATTQQNNWHVEFLINNAGFGALGEFAALDLSRQLEMLQVNILALTELTHLFLQPMKQRKFGAILNVASTAAFQAVPYFAVYAATKAFVLSFSEALWDECRVYGVRVSALCPGSTATNFQEVAGSQHRNAPRVTQTAEAVAQAGLAALAHNRSHIVSGWANKIQIRLERFFPRDVVTKLAGKIFKPLEQKN